MTSQRTTDFVVLGAARVALWAGIIGGIAGLGAGLPVGLAFLMVGVCVFLTFKLERHVRDTDGRTKRPDPVEQADPRLTRESLRQFRD